ncbi:MAG TPA: hypothetical protein VMU15_18850 [Anaeromyxobacter sp.]|nr:hypothetical protein [Anaeromyxobacter sp.]
MPAGWLPPIPALEGLEPTLHPGFGEVEPTPVPGLEPTALGLVDIPDDPLLEEIEATRAAPVEVAVEIVPDLERIHEAVPGDEPTPYPAVVTCRYCRAPAEAGERICGRCGMRLPVAGGQAPAATDAGDRLCSCGAPVRGGRCPVCGARN